jgi:hypothetical protein
VAQILEAHLDSSDPRWRRCWRALHLAATGTVAALQESLNVRWGSSA